MRIARGSAPVIPSKLPEGKVCASCAVATSALEKVIVEGYEITVCKDPTPCLNRAGVTRGAW